MISSNGHFHIGDKVVYPNHGVGIIEQISSRTIGANVEQFYLLKIQSSSLKVMIPFHNVGTVGLRRVIKNGEIQKILDFLTDGDCLPEDVVVLFDLFGRLAINFFCDTVEVPAAVFGGPVDELLEVAAVLKGLLVVNQAKPLSFREKKMLERARYLLVSELAMAKNCQDSDVEDLLTKALAKCNLRFPEASEFEA